MRAPYPYFGGLEVTISISPIMMMSVLAKEGTEAGPAAKLRPMSSCICILVDAGEVEFHRSSAVEMFSEVLFSSARRNRGRPSCRCRGAGYQNPCRTALWMASFEI